METYVRYTRFFVISEAHRRFLDPLHLDCLDLIYRSFWSQSCLILHLPACTYMLCSTPLFFQNMFLMQCLTTHEVHTPYKIFFLTILFLIDELLIVNYLLCLLVRYSATIQLLSYRIWIYFFQKNQE